MDRLEADFLVLDLLMRGVDPEYVLGRLVGIDIRGYNDWLKQKQKQSGEYE